MNYYESNTASAEDNEASAVKVSNKRHQLLFTVGYRSLIFNSSYKIQSLYSHRIRGFFV